MAINSITPVQCNPVSRESLTQGLNSSVLLNGQTLAEIRGVLRSVRKPKGIDEKLDQLRPPIVRGEGTTETERHLVRLAERSFLNLWSYPNPHRNQKIGGKGDGKELCDLLVVCGDHVIIFSEKNIKWSDANLDIAWPRWYKRAVIEAAKQIRGAERWIIDFPEKIFIDPQCQNEFPLALPSPEEMFVHRIIVARGAGEACKAFFGSDRGSFLLVPDLNWDGSHPDQVKIPPPFTICDLDIDGPFYHVLDDSSLNIVMGELDTITDFVEYLKKKEDFIRSGKLALTFGEEDLMAYYCSVVDHEKEHAFVTRDGKEIKNGEKIVIDEGTYDYFIRRPEYKAKKEADKESYVWDQLIKTFTTHMLDGTSIAPDGFKFDIRKNEIAVRHMALERRYTRRLNGKAVLGAIDEIGDRTRFARLIVPDKLSAENKTAYVIFIIRYEKWMEDKGGYDHYRAIRSSMLVTYAQSLLSRFAYLEQAIGIALEPPNHYQGASEDLVITWQKEWTDDDLDDLDRRQKHYNIMTSELRMERISENEYPDANPEVPEGPARRYGSRQQRRAEERRLRKLIRKRK